jgi:hypothetical protein
MGVRGAASAAFVVGAVGAGQVVQATSLGGIVWMNGTLLALGAVAALRLPRNALDRPAVRRRATSAPCLGCGFLPLMALAALVLSSHALHDGFEVLRWQEGASGRARQGYCGQAESWPRWSFSSWWARRCCGSLGQPARPRWLPARESSVGASPLSRSGSRQWRWWNRCMV